MEKTFDVPLTFQELKMLIECYESDIEEGLVPKAEEFAKQRLQMFTQMRDAHIASLTEDEDDDGRGEYTFAIYWYGAKAWFNKEEVAWTNERVSGCEYTDPSLAHAQAYKLLQRHGLSEQVQVIRSDVQP